MEPHASLLKHQVADANSLIRLLDGNGSACDRSEMGTGKSYTAAAVALSLGLETVVVCPKATIPQWSFVLSQFPGTNKRTVINYESLRLGKCPLYSPKTGWQTGERLLIIFDEAHRLRGRNTQTSKIAIQARQAGHKILLLSATLVSSAADLSAIGYALGLFYNPKSWWAYAKRYGGYVDSFRRYTASLAPKHLRALSDCLDRKGVRTTIQDLGEDLPCTNGPELVQFGHAKDIQREYNRLIDSFKTGDETEIARRLAARMSIELLKTEYLYRETQELVANGYSVVLFVNFRETLDRLVTLLGYCSTIFGGQSPTFRQAHIDLFNSNKTKIMVANIRAGGIGLSLHDTQGDHPRVSLISPPESATDLIQCIGRIRRQGMCSPAANRLLCAAGTIEERVFKNVSRKVHAIETINDGDLQPWQRLL